jgi:hypothetical protein
MFLLFENDRSADYKEYNGKGHHREDGRDPEAVRAHMDQR